MGTGRMTWPKQGGKLGECRGFFSAPSAPMATKDHVNKVPLSNAHMPIWVFMMSVVWVGGREHSSLFAHIDVSYSVLLVYTTLVKWITFHLHMCLLVSCLEFVSNIHSTAQCKYVCIEECIDLTFMINDHNSFVIPCPFELPFLGVFVCVGVCACTSVYLFKINGWNLCVNVWHV